MSKTNKELAVELTAAILKHLSPDADDITPEKMRELLRTVYDAVRELPDDS